MYSDPFIRILQRLQIEPEHWLYLSQHFESRFKSLVGTVHKIKQAAKELGYIRAPGIGRGIKLVT